MFDVIYFKRSSVNDNVSIRRSTECGDIEVKALTNASPWGRTVSVTQTFHGNDYEIFFDSLRIVFPDDNYRIGKKFFFHGEKLLGRKSFKTHGDDSISVTFDVTQKRRDNSATTGTTSCLLLPCGYIKCKNRNVITDTIRINFQDFYHYTIM